MPNIKSAQKRMELGRKWQAKNRVTRSRIRTGVKRVRAADDFETAEARLREVSALLDRAARKNLFHPNKVARMKSALHKQVNALKAD